MKKEFKSLDEHRIIMGMRSVYYNEKKIKEFIKKVKMLGWKFYNQRITWREYLEELNKLIGPKLITK